MAYNRVTMYVFVWMCPQPFNRILDALSLAFRLTRNCLCWGRVMKSILIIQSEVHLTRACIYTCRHIPRSVMGGKRHLRKPVSCLKARCRAYVLRYYAKGGNPFNHHLPLPSLPFASLVILAPGHFYSTFSFSAITVEETLSCCVRVKICDALNPHMVESSGWMRGQYIAPFTSIDTENLSGCNT